MSTGTVTVFAKNFWLVLIVALATVSHAIAAVPNKRDRRISPTREGIQNSLRVLSKVDPQFSRLKAEDLIDDRIARKLDQ